MVENSKTETKTTKTEAPKTYRISLLKNYRVSNPKKAKIYEDGEERPLVGTDDVLEDGIIVQVASGEYAKLSGDCKGRDGQVVVLGEAEAKKVVKAKVGRVLEDWA